MNLSALSLTDDGLKWVAGANSSIAKYRHSSSSTAVSHANAATGPTGYRLYQCYPNPFNPSTTITFDIPEQSHVEIKLFNNLGREVKTILNEMKPPGQHQVELYLQNFVSGTYFYRMKTMDFLQTKI